MEVNGVCKPLFVAKASAAHFDGFTSTVDVFRRSISHLEDDGIEDVSQMGFDGLGGRLDGFKSTPHGPEQPALPSLARPSGSV